MLDYGYGDAVEREEAERADDDAERARELLNANAVRFCAACARPVLTRRDRTCLWCDGPTTLPVVGEHHATDSDLPARPIQTKEQAA